MLRIAYGWVMGELQQLTIKRGSPKREGMGFLGE
jgi:hypothetical protein